MDWKTLDTGPVGTLRQRLQTRVYLYCLVRAGHVLTGGQPIDPGQASMLYWFANTRESVSIPTRRELCPRWARLAALGRRDRAAAARGVVRHDDLRQCIRCNYRSLCQRESERTASAEDWLEEDLDLNLELESVEGLDY